MSFFCHFRCHGKNAIYELAKGKDVIDETFEIPLRFNMYRTDGEQIPIELATKLLRMCYSIYTGDEHKEEKATYYGSLGSFFANK